jgi:hypothetical protein
MALLNEAPIWPDGDNLPPQWEYFTVSAVGTNPLSGINWQLDEIGRRGWELCGVAGFTLIFKRPYVDIAKPPVRQHRVQVEA